MGAPMGTRIGSLVAVCAVLAVGLLAHQPADAAEKLVRWGTGFFVSRNGHLLTNFHVVESCRQLTVQSRNGTAAARIVALDPANDLALLATSLKPARIAAWRYAVGEGEPLIVNGFPRGG
jgi:S1-C subfamily serine protease